MSEITLEQIKEKHKAPSTHAYSSKYVVDKVITHGKVDVAVEVCLSDLVFVVQNDGVIF